MRTGTGDVTPDGRLEGTGPDSLPSDTAGGDLQLPDGQRTAHHTTTTSDQLPPPPVYPCRDECTRCGKKTSEDNTDITKGQGLECPCECHENWQNQRQPPESGGLPPAGHIPPTGADCLPGCGYSGLPCFNCSSLRTHLQPQKGATTEGSSPPDHVPTFSPQIYTIELMERPATNVGDDPPVSHHQQIIVESEDWNARNMGISLVSCAIFIIVFIFLFKILFKGAAGYFW